LPDRSHLLRLACRSEAFSAVARAASPETRSFHASAWPLRLPFMTNFNPCGPIVKTRTLPLVSIRVSAFFELGHGRFLPLGSPKLRHGRLFTWKAPNGLSFIQ